MPCLSSAFWSCQAQVMLSLAETHGRALSYMRPTGVDKDPWRPKAPPWSNSYLMIHPNLSVYSINLKSLPMFESDYVGPNYAGLGQKLKSSQISRDEDEIGCISTYHLPLPLYLCQARQSGHDHDCHPEQWRGIGLCRGAFRAWKFHVYMGNEHDPLWDEGMVVD